MKPEFSLNLTPKARADLRTIVRTSRASWGEMQRDRYARQLLDAMDALTRFPYLGRSCAGLSPELRAHAVGRHTISYVVDAPVIRVARVLHTRMEAADQFAS